MQKLKNNEARQKFTGSYKKKRVIRAIYASGWFVRMENNE